MPAARRNAVRASNIIILRLKCGVPQVKSVGCYVRRQYQLGFRKGLVCESIPTLRVAISSINLIINWQLFKIIDQVVTATLAWITLAWNYH